MQKTIVTLAIVIAVAVAAAFLLIDERPSALAEEMAGIRSSAPDTPSRSYRILLGMYASRDENAEDVGSELIATYRDAKAVTNPLHDVEFETYPDDRKIFIPSQDESDLYCRIAESGCLETIFQARDRRTMELERLSVLVSRYDDYLAASDFRTELPPAANEPWGDYRYLLTANRMAIFSAMRLAEAGDVNGAIDAMRANIQAIRGMLATSDMIVHKVITSVSLADSLEALAFIHSVFEADAVEPIPLLTSQETSYRLPLNHEYMLLHAVANALDGSPSMFSEKFDTPAWLGRLAFRPNRLLNDVATRIDAQVTLSESSPAVFAQTADSLDLQTDSLYSAHPGINGTMMVMADVDFLTYIGRAFDINSKIALVNAQISDQPDSLTNPYYPDVTAKLHSNEMGMCMDGPLPDDKYNRCLGLFGLHMDLISQVEGSVE